MKYFEIVNREPIITVSDHAGRNYGLCTVYKTPDTSTENGIKAYFPMVDGIADVPMAALGTRETINAMLTTYIESYTPYVFVDYSEVTRMIPNITIAISDDDYARMILLNDGICGDTLRYDDLQLTLELIEI